MGEKKWFKRKEQVSTIEAPDTEATSEVKLLHFPGMHTVRNINPKTSDDLFYFIPGVNVLPGYIDSDNTSSLNLIDNRKKLIRSICRSYYHAMMDDISEIIAAMDQFPDHDLILDVSNVSDLMETSDYIATDWDFLNHFLSLVTERGVKYKLVRLTDYEIIYIDNLRVASYPYDSEKKASNLYNFFKSSVKNLDQEPFRKVFISRRHAPGQDLENLDVGGANLRKDGLSFNKDARIDDHEALEKIFIDLGYQVIYSERFKTFDDQINFFYTVKTLASLTGSGLANAALMQPGGTVIEIVTPLIVSIPAPNESTKNLENLYFVQEIHNFYKNTAFYQDHTFFALQNPDRSVEKLKNDIESNPKVKAFLEAND